MTAPDGQQPEPLAGRVADGTLAIVLVASPLALGTVTTPVWATLGVATAFASACALRASGPEAPGPHRWVVAAVALGGAAMLLPLLPAPPGVHGWLLPPDPTGGPPVPEANAWRPLHQAPGEGMRHVLRWAVASLFAVAATVRCGTRGGRTSLEYSVLAAGLVALLALAAETAAQVDVAGLLFVNPNHQSAWFSLVAAVAFGVGLNGERPGGRRPEALVVGVAAAAAVVVGSSRSGIGGLAASAAVLGGLLLLPRRRGDGPAPARRPLIFALLLAGLAAFVVHAVGNRTRPWRYGMGGESFDSLAQEQRLALLPNAWEVLGAHPWTGVGRGALYDVLLHYRDVAGTTVARWIEVHPVDVLLDHGVVVGGLVLLVEAALLVTLLRTAWTRRRAAGPVAAVVGLAVHELGDFSAETGAVLLTATALVVFALAGAGTEPWSRRRYGAVVAGLAACLLLAAPAAVRHGNSAACFAERGAAAATPAELIRFEAAERPWHPRSGLLALEVAVRLLQQGESEAAWPFLVRAQQLAPHHPDPHLWTARWLYAAGLRAQALTEYRLAMEGDWRYRARSVFGEVADRYEGTEPLLRLVPAERPGALAEFALWLADRDDPRVVEIGLLSHEQDPDGPAAGLAAVYALLASERYDEVPPLVRRHFDDPRSDPTMRIRLAVAMGLAGEPEEELALLRAALDTAPAQGPHGWLALASREAAAGNPGAARAALRRARSFDGARTQAQSWLAEARLARSEGDLRAAGAAAAEAASADATWADPLVLLAEIGLERGDPAAAVREVLERALQRAPAHPGARTLLERVEELSSGAAPRSRSTGG